MEEAGEDGAVVVDAMGEHVIEEGRGVGGAAGLGERRHGGDVGGAAPRQAAEEAWSVRRCAMPSILADGLEVVVGCQTSPRYVTMWLRIGILDGVLPALSPVRYRLPAISPVRSRLPALSAARDHVVGCAIFVVMGLDLLLD